MFWSQQSSTSRLSKYLDRQPSRPTAMGIKSCNRSAHADFPNVIGLIGSQNNVPTIFHNGFTVVFYSVTTVSGTFVTWHITLYSPTSCKKVTVLSSGSGNGINRPFLAGWSVFKNPVRPANLGGNAVLVNARLSLQLLVIIFTVQMTKATDTQ